MAYKFFQGTFKTDGILDVNNAVTGNALLVDTGGITVTAGSSSFQQLTASAMSASSAQFGTITVAALSAPSLILTSDLTVSGSTILGNGDNQLTTISGAAGSDILLIKANVDVLRASTNNGLQVYGQVSSSNNGIFNGTLTVNGGAASTISSRLNLGKDGGSTSISGSGLLQIAGVKNYEQELRSMGQKIVVRDGGDSTDKAFMDASGQISGSGNFVAGGTLTVNGGSTSAINNRLNLGKDGGNVSVSGSGDAQFGGGLTIVGGTQLNSLTVGGPATFNNTVTIKDLYVTGTMTAIQSTDLNVSDAKIVIASGTLTTASFDGLDPAGVYVGGAGGNGTDAFGSLTLNHNAGAWTWQVFASGANDPAVKIGNGNGGSIAIGSTTVLQQTSLFGGAVTGSSSGVGLKIAATEKTANYTMVVSDYVVAVDTATAAGPVTITLPAAEVGRVYLIKDSGGSASSKNITVQRAGSDTIDGANSIPLQSDYAAVSVVCVAAGKWSLF